MHVHHRCLDALLLQEQGCPDCVVQKRSRGDNGHVIPLPDADTLSNLKPHIVPVKHRSRRTAQAQINRSLMLCNGKHSLSCLRPVCRGYDCHIRYGSHKCHIRYGLMTGSVIGVRQAAVSAAQLYIQAVIGDKALDRVRSSGGQEHGKGINKGNETGPGKSGRHGHHI